MVCCAASTVPAVRIPRESIYASFMRCRAAALMPVCIFRLYAMQQKLQSGAVVRTPGMHADVQIVHSADMTTPNV